MDESLLLRWRKGRAGELDPEERARLERAMEALFVEHEARVYAKCYRRVRDEQLELAQGVPLRLQALGRGSSFIRTTAA